MKPILMTLVACLLALNGRQACGQDQAANQKPVSQEEYQKLKADHEKLKQDMEALKALLQDLLKKAAPQEAEQVKTQVQELQKKSATQQAETDQALDELDKEMKRVKQLAKDSFPG